MDGFRRFAQRARWGLERRAREALDRMTYAADPGWARVRQRVSVPALGDHRQVPVVINNFNRVAVLEQLVDWLARAGMRRIFILDNDSTYPPLLEFYRRVRHVEVVFLRRNLGFRALWRSSFFRRVMGHYYVYTDPDVLPVEECPGDVVRVLFDALVRFPDKQKAGMGLKIDDLPTCFSRHEEVARWEQKFWRVELAPGIYDAPADTTFALYRPWARGGWWIPGLRLGAPHLLRHLPWYADSNHPDDEERYYQSRIQRASSHWTPSTATGPGASPPLPPGAPSP